MYGDSFRNDGYTANEVCCACGGGTTGSASRTKPRSKVLVMSKAEESQKYAMNVTCGCSSCTEDVLQRKTNKHSHEWTVGDQIKFAMKSLDYTETEACLLVCDDVFSNVCSECSPGYCK